MTKRAREQYKLRDATWAAYVEAKTHKVCREQRSKAGHVQRKVRMAYETDLASSAAINPKELFGHIQQNRHLKKQIVTQADLFAETFYRTFRPDTLTPIPVFSKVTQPMPPMVFTPESMMKILQSLSPHKAAGPDELHPKILRALASFIAEPPIELFNLSLLTTEVPKHWRKAIICPIVKQGHR